MGPSTGAIWIDPDFVEDELTTRERYVRDLFAKELIIDNNPTKAALRIGFHHAFAEEFGRKLANEGYTERRVQQLLMQPLTDTEIEGLKGRVTRLAMQEASNHYSRTTARVSALTLLANTLNMKQVPEMDNNGLAIGGVMEVPAMTDPDSWGASAAASQTALKSTVRD